MEKLALNSIKRAENECLKTLRTNKRIPGVVYGHHFNATSISFDYSEFLKLFRISGHTHIIKLSIDGKNTDVLVHDVQSHPVSGDFLHIDFIAVSAKEKLHVKIPLHLVGNSPATREGGMVDQLIHEIDVKCLPADLVDHFEYDISALTEIGQVAHLSELAIDTKKYEIHIDLETPIASILEQKGAVIEEETTVSPSEVPSSQSEDKKED